MGNTVQSDLKDTGELSVRIYQVHKIIVEFSFAIHVVHG